MKTLIIGHTRGIGKALNDLLPNTYGISRSNGYDINNFPNIDLKDYNHIVLNAYGNFTTQLKMIYYIIENKTYKKETLFTIISSIKAYSSYSKDIDRSKYHIEKQAIINSVIDLRGLGYNITSINPSYVDTEFNRDKDILKIKTKMIAKIVKDIQHYYIKYNILISNLIIEQITND